MKILIIERNKKRNTINMFLEDVKLKKERNIPGRMLQRKTHKPRKLKITPKVQ